MRPGFNGSSALERFERGNAIDICNGIMFDFYRDCHICQCTSNVVSIFLPRPSLHMSTTVLQSVCHAVLFPRKYLAVTLQQNASSHISCKLNLSCKGMGTQFHTTYLWKPGLHSGWAYPRLLLLWHKAITPWTSARWELSDNKERAQQHRDTL